jgi:glycosyltransferase involved in cell wall biosynthesis
MAGGAVKIVVVAGHAKSLINFRGPLLIALATAGHEVIACAPEADAEVAARLGTAGVRYCVVPLERTGMNPVKDLLSLVRLTLFFRTLRPDIVFSYTVKPVIYGSLAAKFAGVPAIHSMITGLGYAFLGEGLKGLLINRMVTSLYRAALSVNASVFFQNPDDRSLFVKSRIVHEDKTILINGSGVDIDHFVVAPCSTEPIFLMIARLLRDKGVVEYVEAAKTLKSRHPRAVFLLLGPLDSNPAAISKSTLDAWQREGIIDYLGSTDDVRPFIRSASVYVLPSYREGTPRTVLEAMAMGLPVVTTDAPGCRETVTDGDNGFIVPVKDVAALASAMERFIEDPSLINRMGQRGREIAVEKYDVHKVNAVIMTSMGIMREANF